MSGPPLTWRVLVRRGWLLALGTLAGIAAAAALASIAVSASASYAVRTLEPVQTPFEAAQLARTYARLIPQDPEVVAVVSDATGLSESEVRKALSVVAEPETSILFARFTAADRGTAEAGLRALTRALRTASDSAGSPLRRTVVRVSPPSLSGGFSRTKAIALGALTGFGIALVVALTLERRRPRVDRLQDLAVALPVPVSLVEPGFASLPSAEASLGDGDPFGRLDRVRAVGAGGAGGGISLLVEQGAALAEVEEAWRASAASGAPVSGAFLINRGLRVRRPRGAEDVAGSR
jgi:hypothetical protein